MRIPCMLCDCENFLYGRQGLYAQSTVEKRLTALFEGVKQFSLSQNIYWMPQGSSYVFLQESLLREFDTLQGLFNDHKYAVITTNDNSKDAADRILISTATSIIRNDRRDRMFTDVIIMTSDTGFIPLITQVIETGRSVWVVMPGRRAVSMPHIARYFREAGAKDVLSASALT